MAFTKAGMMGLMLVCLVQIGSASDACATKEVTVNNANKKFSFSCQVYKRGEAPCKVGTPLGEAVGWLVVIGFGALFSVITIVLSRYEYHTLGTAQSSEQFNTAGRNVGPGMTAAVIVSQWTWAATLLMSSNMGWRVGVSGPFWYASGATVQILLFAVLAIQVKRRCSHMHTFMEIVKVRFGTITHVVMMCFALTTNIIVTSMLLLGGSATIEDLTGMSKLTAAFMIPILSCWLYTMYGGLRATFLASYVHTTVIFIMLLIFTFTVYAGSGKEDLWGSPGNVHKALEKATVHGFFNATFTEAELTMSPESPRVAKKTAYFSSLGSIMQNDGMCYNKNGYKTDKSCGFSERGKDSPCCSKTFLGDPLPDGKYCRAADSDCISTSDTKHFQSDGCNFAEGERCVTSFLTMGSTIGLIFGITNIVGNFGTVFVDQSYWQSAVAAKPKSAVLGFLIGGMVWFAVPFCMATTNGLAGRALTTMTSINGEFGAKYIDAGASGSGLTPARVLSETLGPFGAFILLLQLFMAITSTGSAEIIAVSSILTYDVYYEYINPELKSRREKLRRVFYTVIQKFSGQGGVDLMKNPSEAVKVRLEQNPLPVAFSRLQGVMDALANEGFFEAQPSDAELETFRNHASVACGEGETLTVEDLYACVNRAVASNNIEGVILLRVSKFCTGLFAIFMGFLAVFLLTIGMNLGQVYMSMGCLVGSAVGPAALTILMEKANRWAIAAGAVGGLMLAMLGWCLQAKVEFGEVNYDTMMSDWPWVVGNLCAILGGTLIAMVGSLIAPDNEFRWSMLNDGIPLVDDVEPPKDSSETDAKLSFQVTVAIVASVVLTLVLLVLWPIPMHLGSGVFSESGFTVWVTLEFLWAIIGAIVIIFLPGYELVMGFMGKDKIAAKPKGDIKVNVNKQANADSI